MGETTQKTAEAGLVKEFIFGRNEPALHHYHNTYRGAKFTAPRSYKVTCDYEKPIDSRLSTGR